MIDWFVILFIAIVMLIFHMEDIAGHETIEGYFQLPGRNQVSTCTVSMLFRFLTGTFVFIPLFATFSYGYMAGFVLSLTGTLVLLWFRRKMNLITDEYSSFDNFHQFLKMKTKGLGRVAFYLLLFLACSEGLIISGLLAKNLMELAFGIHPIWTSSILFFFVFLFTGMGGARGLQKVGRLLLFLFFIGITVLPIGTVLTQGATLMHERYAALSTVSWQLGTGNLFLTALLFMIFTAGHFLVYFLLSEDLLAVKRSRLKTTIGLSVVCWSSMPIAVSVMGVYFLTKRGISGFEEFVSNIGSSLSYPLLYVLIISILSCFALSLGISLHYLIRLITPLLKGKRKVYQGYAVSFWFCVLASLATLLFDLKTVFIFYIHLFMSLSFPLWFLLKYRFKWGFEMFFTIVLTISLGLWVSYTSSVLSGLSANLGMEGVILYFLLIRKIRTIQK